MTERDGNSARAQKIDELERARQLGRERHQGDGPGRQEPLEQRRVRVAPMGGVVRTEARRREERAFEMRARDPGRALTAWQRAERPAQHLLARRDERGQNGRDPGREQCLACGRIPRLVRGEEVDSRDAVHLEIHESRRRDPASRTSRATDRHDAVAVDLDIAGQQPPTDERRLDAEPHRRRPVIEPRPGLSSAPGQAPQ